MSVVRIIRCTFVLIALLINRYNSLIVCIHFSCNSQLNLDYLLEILWEYLALIRVYTKKPGQAPDFNDCLILRRGVTVEHVCHAIHRSLVGAFKYALVWVRREFLTTSVGDGIRVTVVTCIFQGTSTKYSPQRVGMNHIMDDEDVIQIVKK